MDFNLDFINILILVVIVLNFSLGIFVFFTKRESKINQYFFTFSITATLWGLSMLFFRGLAGSDFAVSFARILYACAALIPFSFIFFIQVFPEEKYNFPKIFDYLLSLPFIVVILISIIPNQLILGVSKQVGGEPIIYFNYIYHIFYAFYIVGYFSICYALLFIKYYRFKDIEKQQITYVIFGTFVATVIGVSTNLLMPILGDFRLNWMGQIGIIAMVGAISYSILRHRLFNSKVVATQFIVFILCTSLFMRALLSSGQSDLIINSSFLVLTIIIGALLLKSVLHEVEQREKLEVLTKDLENANKDLERVNKDLASANDRLKELDVMKSEFLSFATHQIRAPLTAIKGYASLLLEGDFGDMIEPVRGAVHTIFDSCQNLVVIVNEFLDISRIEQGRMKYDIEDFDLKKLCADTLNELRPNIEKQGLTSSFSADDRDFIWNGDKGKIKQVIGNFIDNAIKYTPHGSLTMKLSVNNKNGQQSFLVTLSDTGIGIAKEDIPKLFSKFSRTKEANKQNVIGTGLGLYVAKQMVEAQKGKVWVESKGQGLGSTFFIELPIKKV
jgi:signal transduction histidine kinase